MQAFFSFTYTFFLLILSSWAATNYCDIPNCASGTHSMCLYPNGSSTGCNRYNPVPLSDGEMKTIVETHNQLRQKVANGLEIRGKPGPQLPASNMKEMKWDDELAMVAQRWADQCSLGHDMCRNVERFRVGQNVYQGISSTNEPLSVNVPVETWYNECRHFDRRGIFPYRYLMLIGDYTQLVWADTSYVGCARSQFQEGSMYVNNFVCNYGSAGNIIGEPMYRIGEPGSRCTMGPSANYTGLCSA